MAPLRDRTEDIEELVEHFLKRFGEKLSRTVEGLEPDALEALGGYGWPGNIRELENVIERTLLFCDSDRIRAQDLPPEVVQPSGKQVRAAPATKPAAAQAAADGSRSLKEVVKGETKRLEREMILNALEETGGNVTRAARLLKISRKSLQLKMKELGLRQRGSTPDPDRG
jgi:DNA-binding NtrC family response regulator